MKQAIVGHLHKLGPAGECGGTELFELTQEGAWWMAYLATMGAMMSRADVADLSEDRVEMWAASMADYAAIRFGARAEPSPAPFPSPEATSSASLPTVAPAPFCGACQASGPSADFRLGPEGKMLCGPCARDFDAKGAL